VDIGVWAATSVDLVGGAEIARPRCRRLTGDGIKRVLCSELHEVAIVSRGAIEGAEVTHKLHLPELAGALSHSFAPPQPHGSAT